MTYTTEGIKDILNKNNKLIDLNLLIENLNDIRSNSAKINLLVNDMNISPDSSIEIVDQAKNCLKNIEMMVITLKSFSLKDISKAEIR